ncbi:hypothetical protein DFS34DRAFT_634060 [Phlyctochytrium arcticum]|nr:hypothetical protein DFS34DRAFT_634060 [Phlyctochytrium arcticum]
MMDFSSSMYSLNHFQVTLRGLLPMMTFNRINMYVPAEDTTTAFTDEDIRSRLRTALGSERISLNDRIRAVHDVLKQKKKFNIVASTLVELSQDSQNEIENLKRQLHKTQMKMEQGLEDKVGYQVDAGQQRAINTGLKAKVAELEAEIERLKKNQKRPLALPEDWGKTKKAKKQEGYGPIENIINFIAKHDCTYDITPSVTISLSNICGLSTYDELTAQLTNLENAQVMGVFLRAVMSCVYFELFGTKNRDAKRWHTLNTHLNACIIPVFCDKPSLNHVADDNFKLDLLQQWLDEQRRKPTNEQIPFIAREKLLLKFLTHIRSGETDEALNLVPKLRGKRNMSLPQDPAGTQEPPEAEEQELDLEEDDTV